MPELKHSHVICCLMLFCPSCIWAVSAEVLYQRALMAEKEMGQFQKALVDYEAVIEAFQSGAVDVRLALRAQMRANLLRERLGLAAVSFRISTGPLRSRQVVAPGRPQIAELRRAVRLMPQFSQGIRSEETSKDHRFRFEKEIQDWMVEKGIGRMLAFVVNSQEYLERVQPQGRFERQVRALNQALGGRLAEVLDRAEREDERMLTPEELYRAGLMAEKDRGDLEAAVGFYEQALAQSNLAPQLAQQIRRRLDLCAGWLVLK